jgi:hypothetical protein
VIPTSSAAPPDFRGDDHGPIVALTPLSARARKWVDRRVVSEPWQWQGATLMIDPRYAAEIVSAPKRARMKVI